MHRDCTVISAVLWLHQPRFKSKLQQVRVYDLSFGLLLMPAPAAPFSSVQRAVAAERDAVRRAVNPTVHKPAGAGQSET